MTAAEQQECCQIFDPTPWDEKLVTWHEKEFVKDHVTSIFHIPLNYDAVMARSLAAIHAAGVLASPRIILTDENSLWGSDVYIGVSGSVPGHEVVRMSGTFLTKVFEGPFSNIKKWVGEMTAYVQAQGKSVNKLFFFYTTCPKCAKKYGRNYVVLLAKL